VLQLLHSVLTRNAYVNVHLNDGAGLSTIVAQGNRFKRGKCGSKTYNVLLWNYCMFFNGEGLTNSNNPNFTFKREYIYLINDCCRAFLLNSVQGTGTANYNSGVTNNGAVSGSITFTVHECTKHAVLQLSISWFYVWNDYDYKLMLVLNI
jgi:hypothetical protein